MFSDKLLRESQSGFRCKHSCHTALTNLTDRWLKYMDDGHLKIQSEKELWTK
jgi:hypothetical protein